MVQPIAVESEDEEKEKEVLNERLEDIKMSFFEGAQFSNVQFDVKTFPPPTASEREQQQQQPGQIETFQEEKEEEKEGKKDEGEETEEEEEGEEEEKKKEKEEEEIGELFKLDEIAFLHFGGRVEGFDLFFAVKVDDKWCPMFVEVKGCWETSKESETFDRAELQRKVRLLFNTLSQGFPCSEENREANLEKLKRWYSSTQKNGLCWDTIYFVVFSTQGFTGPCSTTNTYYQSQAKTLMIPSSDRPGEFIIPDLVLIRVGGSIDKMSKIFGTLFGSRPFLAKLQSILLNKISNNVNGNATNITAAAAATTTTTTTTTINDDDDNNNNNNNNNCNDDGINEPPKKMKK